MALTDGLDGYADAILAIAEAEGQVDQVGSELARVGRAIESSAELRETLADSKIPVERKLGVLGDLLGGKVSPVTLHLASMVVGLGHGSDLTSIADRLSARAADRRGAAVAEIRAATELDDETLGCIAAALSKRIGRAVETKLVIDASVVGGFIATVGDVVIDASVKSRLDEVGRQLVRG